MGVPGEPGITTADPDRRLQRRLRLRQQVWRAGAGGLHTHLRDAVAKWRASGMDQADHVQACTHVRSKHYLPQLLTIWLMYDEQAQSYISTCALPLLSSLRGADQHATAAVPGWGRLTTATWRSCRRRWAWWWSRSAARRTASAWAAGRRPPCPPAAGRAATPRTWTSMQCRCFQGSGFRV
jgi:hypothetical protein